MMTKTERIDAVLSGQKPDRDPISCWYHFGTQYLPGEKYADIVFSFYEYYGFDWLKVMNDYFYPMPVGYDALKSVEDLKQLKPIEIDATPLHEQLTAIDIINNRLKGEAYVCDTIFDPYQSLQKSPVGEYLPRLMKEEPQAVLDALEIVTQNTIEYAKRTLALGTHGIFMSILSGEDKISKQDFLVFEKPFAMKVFAAVKEMGPMNTAHLHGKHIDIDECLDFPVAVLSWEDRQVGNPSLQEVKRKWSGAVMGGIDNTIMTRRTPEFLMKHTLEGIEMGGKSRFFLANGCSSPAEMDTYALKAIVDVAQQRR
jgi:uroporphyrinogen decarboxylase